MENLRGREGRKESRWNIGALFRRKEREVVSKGVTTEAPVGGAVSDKPPPLPPKNSHVFQPSLQVRGGQGRMLWLTGGKNKKQWCWIFLIRGKGKRENCIKRRGKFNIMYN